MFEITVSIPVGPGASNADVALAVESLARSRDLAGSTNVILFITLDGEPGRASVASWADVQSAWGRPFHLIRRDENVGRYHCDAVVLGLTTTPYFTVVDSDDVVLPHHLSMLRLAVDDDFDRPDVVFTSQLYVEGFQQQPHLRRTVARAIVAGARTPNPKVIRPRVPSDDPPAFGHYGHMAGLWRTDFLRSIGGPHPSYRIGYDSMLSTLAWRFGSVLAKRHGAESYARFKRDGSLTTSGETGFGSAARTAARLRMECDYERISAGDWNEVGRYRESIPSVTDEVGRLRKELGL